MSRFKEWKIGYNFLQFEEANHAYYCNGVRCPSITEVVSHAFPDKYKGVDKNVLENAANKGTQLHASIEAYEKLGIVNETLQEVKNYIKLKDKNKFEAVENEIPIILRYKDMTICGQLDEIIKEGDEYGIGDIKRTYTLDLSWLKLQLNLYRMGYLQCYDTPINFLRGLHLRNKINRYVAIPIDVEYAYEALEDYYINVFKGETKQWKKQKKLF